MLWDDLRYAHRQFCQYHIIVHLCYHFASSVAYVRDTDPFKSATIFFSCAMPPHHTLELFGLDHITSNTLLAGTHLPLDPWTYWVTGYNCDYHVFWFKGHCQWLIWSIIFFSPSHYHRPHYTLLITLPKHQSLFYKIQEGLYQLGSWQKRNYICNFHNLKRVK